MPDPLHGREVWRLGAQAMREAFPDLKIGVQDIFGADDKVTVLVHFHGTHQGTFQHFEATGRQVSCRRMVSPTCAALIVVTPCMSWPDSVIGACLRRNYPELVSVRAKIPFSIPVACPTSIK
ncbi:ester cyclase [Streptomyces tubercidicus]|nr:ester cyclase [Streptomyces tubercidicus]WAU16817.1 ester cyclase [Streptomyces tubercidicus]